MRILSVTVGLVLLAGVSHAQPNQLWDVTVTKETTLGSLKTVEGDIAGPVPGSDNPPHVCTVWVNGISTQADPAGHFRVLVPNEAVTKVAAWQPKLNVLVDWLGRDLKRKAQFKTAATEPEIRDLLNKQPVSQVASGGGDGGIRDLLRKPPTDVASGGGDGGIRDLLRKPSTDVASGGGDGGIRDLLNKPAANPSDVASGGGDGGIRDLLNKPQTGVASGGGDGGIRDLLHKPPVASGGGDGGIRDLLHKPAEQR